MTKTTKICDKCKDDKMIPLYSTNEKICPTCSNIVKWDLDKGQKPIFGDKT